MKRPIGVYFVAFWFYFGFVGMIWNPITKIVLPKITQDQNIISFVTLVGALISILIIVGIFQVKVASRNIAITLLGLLSLYQLFAISTFIIYGPINWQVIGYKLFLTIPSILCVVYLVRPSFRTYAKEFLEFKDQEAERKKILKRMPQG